MTSEAVGVYLITAVWMLVSGFLTGWAFGWWRGYNKGIWRMTQDNSDE